MQVLYQIIFGTQRDQSGKVRGALGPVAVEI
jgi:hypothetical protein